MNGNQPSIQIFEPFGAAYELMKKILFQPFDLGKWCIIGFAAFMSGSIGGGFRIPFTSKQHWNLDSFIHTSGSSSDSFQCWVVPFIVTFWILIVAIAIVLMWVSARGRFIFTDCVVRNRAAIALPWNEYRREGNSFFLFSLVVAVLTMMIVGGLALMVAVPLGLFSHHKASELHAIAIIALVFIGLIALCIALFVALVTHFMVPVMYRRRCLAREAFSDVINLFLAQPGPIILFVLFGIVLVMAVTVVSTVVSCITCCIAGLPYVSSVVLLPAFVWLLAFKLLFLRQFGPEYDVWAVVESPALPPTPEPPATPQPPSPSDAPPPPPAQT